MHLRRLLLLLTIVGITLLGETPANAQYATTRVDHDWTITIFGGRFGYEQRTVIPYGGRADLLYWGGGVTRVGSNGGSKGWGLPIGISAVVAGLILWRVRGKRRLPAPIPRPTDG